MGERVMEERKLKELMNRRKEKGASYWKSAFMLVVSELDRNGQRVIRRCIRLNEAQNLNYPDSYMSLDPDGQVFAADRGNGKEGKYKSFGRMRARKRLLAVSEPTYGQIHVDTETQDLGGTYLLLDSDDRVFVADPVNDRVILFDPDLKWNQTLFLNRTEKEEQRALGPLKLCYNKEMKQMIVGRYFGGVYIYTLSRN